MVSFLPSSLPYRYAALAILTLLWPSPLDSGDLYLDYNGTGAPPSDLTIVVPQKQVLLNISGTQWDPAKAVTHSGITFTAS